VLDNGSRMIVVSWMVEVAEEFGLQQETLHAAVSLLDRFLSTSNVRGGGVCAVGGGGAPGAGCHGAPPVG
jgi:cyclin A